MDDYVRKLQQMKEVEEEEALSQAEQQERQKLEEERKRYRVNWTLYINNFLHQIIFETKQNRWKTGT